MSLNPTSFSHTLTAGSDHGKRLSETTYKVKIYKELRKIWPALTLDRISLLHNHNVAYPEEDIKAAVDDPKFSAIYIEKLSKVSILSLFHMAVPSKPYKRLLAIDDDEHSIREGRGLIFPVENAGDWIIHNLGTPDDTSVGRARIIMPSKDFMVRDLYIEPLSQFINDRRAQ